MGDMLTMLDAKQATFKKCIIVTGGSMQWRRLSTMCTEHGSAFTSNLCEYVESATVLSTRNDWRLIVAYLAVLHETVLGSKAPGAPAKWVVLAKSGARVNRPRIFSQRPQTTGSARRMMPWLICWCMTMATDCRSDVGDAQVRDGASAVIINVR